MLSLADAAYIRTGFVRHFLWVVQLILFSEYAVSSIYVTLPDSV
jgi:hypothetical protein